MLRKYLKSGFFCAIWESTLRYITWCDPYLAGRCFQKLLPSPLFIKGRTWTTSSAMDVFPYSTAPRFPCWEGTYPKSSFLCLCAIWVSTLADIALSNPWVALTCFWKLIQSILFIKGRLWTISTAMKVSHCSISSHFPVLRRYLKSDFFCAIWESTFGYITWCGPYLAGRCFQKLLPSPLYIKGRIWNTSSAMDVFPYSIAPHI